MTWLAAGSFFKLGQLLSTCLCLAPSRPYSHGHYRHVPGQGRFAPLESAPPACLRAMRPHTAAMWQALGDTQARRTAMTTLLAYTQQQLAALASALPAGATAQADAAAGTTPVPFCAPGICLSEQDGCS